VPPFSSPRLRVRDIVKAQSLFRSILLKSSRQIPSSQSVRPLNPCAAMYAFRRSRSDFSHPQCLQFSVGEQTAFPRPSRQVNLPPQELTYNRHSAPLQFLSSLPFRLFPSAMLAVFCRRTDSVPTPEQASKVNAFHFSPSTSHVPSLFCSFLFLLKSAFRHGNRIRLNLACPKRLDSVHRTRERKTPTTVKQAT